MYKNWVSLKDDSNKVKNKLITMKIQVFLIALFAIGST